MHIPTEPPEIIHHRDHLNPFMAIDLYNLFCECRRYSYLPSGQISYEKLARCNCTSLYKSNPIQRTPNPS